MLEGTATWLQGFTHALEAEELPRPCLLYTSSAFSDHLATRPEVEDLMSR